MMKVLNPYGGPVMLVPVCKECDRKDKRIAELEAENQLAWNTCDEAETKLRRAEARLNAVQESLREIGRLIRNNVVGVYDEDRRHWMGIDKELRAILAKREKDDE